MPLSLGGNGTVTGLDWAGSGGGLTRITSSTFSAAATVSVDGCFTSTYSNYRIVVRFSGSASADSHIRMRASGSDYTASEYSFAYFDYTSGVSATGLNASQSSWLNVFRTGSTGGSFIIIDILTPYTADYTQFVSVNGQTLSTYRGFQAVGMLANTSLYDGFTLIPGNGTITGTLRVYGYIN